MLILLLGFNLLNSMKENKMQRKESDLTQDITLCV